VKKAILFGSSSHNTSSHSWRDTMLLDSTWSALYMPSPYGARQSSYPPAQARGLMIEDDTDISICNHEELVSFESLHGREFAHTRVYDVSLLERVGVDIELPTVLSTLRWEKHSEVPRLGSRLFTLKFLTTFDTYARGRKCFVLFCLFRRELESTIPILASSKISLALVCRS
jgi:hypothetical protein